MSKDSGAPNHSKMVNNPQFSDFTLHFPGEKPPVDLHSHSVVLNVRCPALANPKDAKKFKVKKKKTSTTIDISHIPSSIMLEILYYVYTGTIEFTKLNVEQIISIYTIAGEFELPRLQWICENFLRNNLNLQNAHIIIKSAHQLGHKSIKEFGVYYAVKNYADFIANKDGSRDLGMDLFSEIAEVFQQGQVGEVKAPPALVEPADNLVADFKKIYETMEQPDGVFQFATDRVYCHRSVLSAQSEDWQRVCQTLPKPLSKDKDKYVWNLAGIKTKTGNGPTISGESFKSCLRFIYYGEEKIDPSCAIELIPFAKDYNLPLLQNVCERIASFNINDDTVLNVLAVTYMPQMEDRETVAKELKKDSINYILNHLDSVDVELLHDMNPDMAIDIILAKQSLEKMEEDKTKGGFTFTLRPQNKEPVLPDLRVPPLPQ